MNIGSQIKAMRLRRGATQEALARHLGVTAQAVSKWENGTAAPDISLLPELSAYFGVSIDELFALSDETRMSRIQNMLYDVRFIAPAAVEGEILFLQEKAKREPHSSQSLEMLANLEMHLAAGHHARAAEYALAAISRSPDSARAHTALAHAMGGKHVDPRNNFHNELISHYKACIAEHPEAANPYAWLIAQLIDDGRLAEARHYCDQMAEYDSSYYVTVQRVKIALAENRLADAKAMWTDLARSHPTNWSVHHWIGDFQAQTGDYAAAKESYRRAIELMEAPHYADPIDSLAKICEIDGDIPGAIAARQLELEIAEKEWGDVSGESVDCICREIQRLKRMQ